MDPEIQAAIEKQMKEASEGVIAIREVTEKNAKRLDAIDLDKMNKASEDSSKALEVIQQLNASLKALEDAEKERILRIDTLEKQLAKGIGGKGDDSERKEVSVAHQRALNASITGGTRLKSFGGETELKNIEQMVKAYLPNLSEEAHAKAVKTLMVGSGPDGGYFVPVDTQTAMITRIFETSPMRQLSSRISTTAPMVEFMIDDDEATATWGNELSVPVDNRTPQVGETKIPVHNLYARQTVTENMLEDSSIDIVGWMSEKQSDKFARTENTNFVIGIGVDRPRGFLTYPASANPDVYERGAVGVVQAATPNASGLFVANDLINVQNHLKEPYQSNASWLLKRRTFFNVVTLKDNQGQFLLRFGDALSTGFTTQVLGRPVVFADDMPAVAGGSKSIAYGDFRSGYMIVDRVGITVLRDPYTADPKIRYRFRKRVGGGVVDYDAIKILQVPAA